MFDIGFWELVLIATIGLVVVGPQKLPEVVRTVYGFIRRVRRTFDNVRYDIERELNIDDLRKDLPLAQWEEEQQRVHEKMRHWQNEVESSGKALLNQIDRDVNAPFIEGSARTDDDSFNEYDLEEAIDKTQERDPVLEELHVDPEALKDTGVEQKRDVNDERA